jgi:hypothetical protein
MMIMLPVLLWMTVLSVLWLLAGVAVVIVFVVVSGPASRC